MDKPKRKTFYKHCIVRTCGNNSTKSPGKAYIKVPLDQELRRKWMNAVGRKTTEFSSTNKGIYVCEDHFELESDMENYLEWKLTGEEEIMKKSAVPRLIHIEGIRNESDRRELDPLLGLHEEISIKIEPPEEDLKNKMNVTVSDVLRDKSSREETMSVEGLVNEVIVAPRKLRKQTPKPIFNKDLNKKVNLIVSDIVRDKSLRAETVSGKCLVNTVIQNKDLVARRKLKKQSPKPIFNEEDLNNKINVTISDVVRVKSSKEETVSVKGLVNTVMENRDLTSKSNEQNINLAMNIQTKVNGILEDNRDSFKKLTRSEAQSHQSVIKKQILSICGVADGDKSGDFSSMFRKYVSLLSSENIQQKQQDIQECKDIKTKSLEKLDQKNEPANTPAARRSTMCPLCSKRIGSHLPRHLERQHKDNKEVRLLRKLNPNSQERAQLLTAMRKRGYFRLKIESNILIPVRASSNPDVKYFVCPYCLGHYSKRFLHRHVKHCDRKPKTDAAPPRSCLATSQTFMAEVNAKRGDSISSQLRDEVFAIMRPDNISFVAKNDPLIRLYGDKLLVKPGRSKTASEVSNKIREMSRLLLALRSTRDLAGLMDALKPEMFDELITATKAISGYNPTAKTFRTPSLAFHMGNNLRFLCSVALGNASDDKKCEIQQLKTLLHVRWSSSLSSLIQRDKPCGASQESPLTSNLKLLDKHIDALALDAFERLSSGVPIALGDYKQLVECVLGKTVLFNRETVDQVQCLTLDSYGREEREVSTKTLTDVEEVLAGRLKTVACGDQKEGFVLIPDLTRVYIDRLLRLREESDVVTQFNAYLFAAPGSGNKWLAGDGVLRKLARDSGAKNPEGLVSARYRNQIATTLQLMAVREEELEQLATNVGLRSPEGIHQKAELARLLLEKQHVVEFQETNFDETQPEHNISKAESEDDDIPLLDRLLNRVESLRKDGDSSSNRLENSIREPQGCESTGTKVEVYPEKWDTVKRTRISWSEEEKSMVRKHFSKHIRNNIPPKKLECEEFLRSNPQLFQGRGWVQLKAFVYNTYRMMQ